MSFNVFGSGFEQNATVRRFRTVNLKKIKSDKTSQTLSSRIKGV